MPKICSSPWAFIQPVESSNMVLNPSAEIAGNFSALGTGTATRSSSYNKYGLYSYRVVTGSNGAGITLTTGTLTNAEHFVTFRVRGKLPVNTRVIIGTGLRTPQKINQIDPYWTLYGCGFNAAECSGRSEVRIIQQGNGSGDFYLDGVQCEPLSYWTSYIDGTQPGCYWNGIEHAAISIRSGESYEGGQLKDFYDDYGFLVEKILGGGSPVQNINTDEYAVLPGGEVNSVKVLPREMTIIGKFICDDELELFDLQESLRQALSPETSVGNQPVRLVFSGGRVQKEIKATYRGGLEGELSVNYDGFNVEGDNQWSEVSQWLEKASIQFLCTDPYWYETGESAVSLDTNDSATFRNIAARLKSTGQWDNVGPPDPTGTYIGVTCIAEDSTYIYLGGYFSNWDNGGGANIIRWHKQNETWSRMGAVNPDEAVRAMVLGPDGSLYVGGTFTNIDNVLHTAYIAKWDPVTETWSALGLGMDDSVFALTIGLDGILYAGGSFLNASGGAALRIAKWNGIGWSTMGSGANGFVSALATGPDGTIYAGGFFTAMGGVANTNKLAKWDGSSWSAWGTGVSAGTNVYAIAIGANRSYIAGLFSAVSGVSASNVAAWNGTAWEAMGTGVNDTAYGIVIGPDGIVYVGGFFTTAGGISLNDRVARWNGSSWAHLDIDLPGSPTVDDILASKYVDPVIPQKYDLYVGFDTTGTGYFGGKTTVNNEGSVPAFPKIVFERNGGTNIIIETLRNERTGKELLFNYTLLDGERLTIDLTPTQKSIWSSYWLSRLDAVLPNSDFGVWALKPGNNDVTCFTADDFALYPSSLTAYMLWKDKYQSFG